MAKECYPNGAMPAKRTRCRLFTGLPALLLALVVLADAALAGRGYVYCTAMQSVMDHACCAKHAGAAESSSPVVAALPRDCCQARSHSSLGLWTTQSSRNLELPPPLVAIVPRAALVHSARELAANRYEARRMHTGPPPSRALALRMVFQI